MLAQDKLISELLGDNSDQDASEDYDSDAELRKGGRNPKRRKLDEDNESSDGKINNDSEKEDDQAFKNISAVSPLSRKRTVEKQTEHTTQDQIAANKSKAAILEAKKLDDMKVTIRKNVMESFADPTSSNTGENKEEEKKKSKLDKEAASTADAAKKSGVLYLSRIPRFMQPHEVRDRLGKLGRIDRIWLIPEDEGISGRKKKKRRNYVEGWVEFARKSDAKKVVDLLNARPIGGKKGSPYYDEIWTLVYLKGFKWHHLTQQIEAETRERESRLRAELERTQRENEAFMENLDKAKMVRNMERKRKRRQQESGDGEGRDKEEKLKESTVRKQGISKREVQPEAKAIISNIF